MDEVIKTYCWWARTCSKPYRQSRHNQVCAARRSWSVTHYTTDHPSARHYKFLLFHKELTPIGHIYYQRWPNTERAPPTQHTSPQRRAARGATSYKPNSTAVTTNNAKQKQKKKNMETIQKLSAFQTKSGEKMLQQQATMRRVVGKRGDAAQGGRWQWRKKVNEMKYPENENKTMRCDGKQRTGLRMKRFRLRLSDEVALPAALHARILQYVHMCCCCNRIC